MPLLPVDVQRQGIAAAKSSAGLFLIAGFISANNTMSAADIGDYITANLMDSLGRLRGIGQVMQEGSQYAVRVWCDPSKLEQYALNPSDLVAVIREQNNQVAAGQAGASPARPGQELAVTLNASSRFETVEEFENILVRTEPDGSFLRLKDVARIELNSEMFLQEVYSNGRPAAALLFRSAPGANALDAADTVKNALRSMSEFFPPGLTIVYPYDTTQFIKISIEAVFTTLGEAVILVFLVMFLFLQSFRATIITTLVVPVVMLGTFGILAAAGFSINTLTMFGMVLAIGLLVDDAIVVVENVERLMRQEGLSPKEATVRSMERISGVLVGVALVIAAVFVPMAFIGGSIGVIYRQFSVTIVASMALSAFTALTFTPALCASLLKPGAHASDGVFFSRFNRLFARLTSICEKGADAVLGSPGRCLTCFAAGVMLVCLLFYRLPTSFLPDEDQGNVFVTVQLPSGASLERTRAVLAEVDRYFQENEGDLVDSVFTVAGDSFMGRGENTGQAYINLAPWKRRGSAEKRVQAVMNRARAYFSGIPQARIFVFAPPPVLELGNASGFTFELQDRAGKGHDALTEARNILLGKAAQDPALLRVRPAGLDDVEQYSLRIDLAEAGALGLRKGEIDDALSAYWGGVYVNDFMDRGRTKKVYLRADAPFRMQPGDFRHYFIRNDNGDMVPFSSFLSVASMWGSPKLERYDGVPSIEIQGEAAPGMSSGQAMAAMERIASELPPGFGFSWTGMSYQEKRAGSRELFLYAVSLAVVFLCLAALYESWSVPFAVLAVMPAGVLGALLGVSGMGMSNDIYFKIGMLTIMGLSAKNAVLIVEFTKALHDRGEDIVAAARRALRIRLRPIVMTSLAFTLGVIPLALSSDAGSGAQNAVGVTVVSGVVLATLLGIFLTPLFYVTIVRLFGKVRKNGIPSP
jgi:multidrug efflux pump